MTNPLDKEFNMEELDDENPELEIPEDKEARDLDLIIDYALKSYKDIIDSMNLIEPKNRAKYYEIAERFLQQAKDARYKRDYLLQKERFHGKGKSKQSEEGDDSQEEEGISQEELLEQRQQLKRVK